MVALNKIQLEIREKLVVYALNNLADDYNLSTRDVGDIFGISRQAVFQINKRINNKKKGK